MKNNTYTPPWSLPTPSSWSFKTATLPCWTTVELRRALRLQVYQNELWPNTSLRSAQLYSSLPTTPMVSVLRWIFRGFKALSRCQTTFSQRTWFFSTLKSPKTGRKSPSKDFIWINSGHPSTGVICSSFVISICLMMYSHRTLTILTHYCFKWKLSLPFW